MIEDHQKKLEGLSAKVSMGANNPDGSTGINVGASANVAAAEVTRK